MLVAVQSDLHATLRPAMSGAATPPNTADQGQQGVSYNQEWVFRDQQDITGKIGRYHQIAVFDLVRDPSCFQA